MLGFLLFLLRRAGGAVADAGGAGMGTVDGRGGTSTGGGGACNSGAESFRDAIGGRVAVDWTIEVLTAADDVFLGCDGMCALEEVATGKGCVEARFSVVGGGVFFASLGRCVEEEGGVLDGVCGLDEEDVSVSESE